MHDSRGTQMKNETLPMGFFFRTIDKVELDNVKKRVPILWLWCMHPAVWVLELVFFP